MTSLTLEPTDGHPLTSALPGQFIVLRLRPAPDAPALLRSYSLSGEPSDARYRVSVKRENHGAAGAYIETQVRVGDVLDVSAPRGNFTLRSGDGPVVLLSAGIGATPVLAMLHALAADASQREVWWIYGARDGGEHPFAAETRTLLEALPRSHGHIRYSSPRPADRPAARFRCSRTLERARAPGTGRAARCRLLSVRAARLHERSCRRPRRPGGSPSDRVHTENFGSGPSKTPGIAAGPRRPPHRPAGPEGTGPLVSFARSNLAVRWGAAFHSILELAEACDVPVRWSCRTGVCHTCETGLIGGAVGYEPDPVEPPADGAALICCSQPTGRHRDRPVTGPGNGDNSQHDER